MRIHQRGSTSVTSEATALTAPSRRMAEPERRAALRSDPARALSRGSRIQGATAIGQISELTAPRPMSIRGAKA